MRAISKGSACRLPSWSTILARGRGEGSLLLALGLEVAELHREACPALGHRAQGGGDAEHGHEGGFGVDRFDGVPRLGAVDEAAALGIRLITSPMNSLGEVMSTFMMGSSMTAPAERQAPSKARLAQASKAKGVAVSSS